MRKSRLAICQAALNFELLSQHRDTIKQQTIASPRTCKVIFSMAASFSVHSVRFIDEMDDAGIWAAWGLMRAGPYRAVAVVESIGTVSKRLPYHIFKPGERYAF